MLLLSEHPSLSLFTCKNDKREKYKEICTSITQPLYSHILLFLFFFSFLDIQFFFYNFLEDVGRNKCQLACRLVYLIFFSIRSCHNSFKASHKHEYASLYMSYTFSWMSSVVSDHHPLENIINCVVYTTTVIRKIHKSKDKAKSKRE